MPWVPHNATGVVTQGVRAGDDLGRAHADPGKIAPNYWLGLMLPGQSIPFWDSPNVCGDLQSPSISECQSGRYTLFLSISNRHSYHSMTDKEEDNSKRRIRG